jgi:hypothetical protein
MAEPKEIEEADALPMAMVTRFASKDKKCTISFPQIRW